MSKSSRTVETTYELTLADQGEAEAALAKGSNCSGVYYELGDDVEKTLRRHPLAVAELGRPKRYDAIQRGGDGYYHQIGRVMRLLRIP